jgi:FAD/FMN-containing dehydrogenase
VTLNRRDFLVMGATLPAIAFLDQSDSLARFRRAFGGQVIAESDPDYDRARSPASFNPFTDKRPYLIARCRSPKDVVLAIEFARSQGLEVAVRAGGHDVLGASVCEGGLVIDVSGMKSIDIDPRRARARVAAGVRAGELHAATAAHGLAPVLGCNPAVGVAGLTLGGGLGWFLGRFGAACDNLLAADIVTADGRQRHVSADDHADLFWGLRGGGGNFGIVTAFEYQLHPIGDVLGGLVAWRTDLGAFLRFYGAFMRSAPDELTAELSIVMIDAPVVLATVCWSGDRIEGERVLRPLREFGPPLADAIGVVPFAHLTDRPGPAFGARVFGPPTADQNGGRVNDYWKGGSLNELTDPAIEQIETTMESARRGMSVGLGHYMHGQVCRIEAGATPLPRVPGQFTYFFDANWRAPARAEAAMAWVRDACTAMRRFSSAGTYVNYLSDDRDVAVRDAYQSNYARLVSLKRKYDPANQFHLNRNIRPDLQ